MATYTLDQLSKVLAKAENNPNEHEAEIAMERAMKMAAAMNIDLALARSHQEAKERERPEKRITKVGDPRRTGNNHLMELFTEIAMANDLKVTISGETIERKDHTRETWDGELQYVSGYQFRPSIYCTAYGFPSDHEVTAKVYAVAVSTMLAQAGAALKAGKQKEAGVDGRVWRAEFYRGFTSHLSTRLWTLKREATEQAKALEMAGSNETALVLADKAEEVEDFYKNQNPHFYREDGSPRKNRATWKGDRNKDTYVGHARRAGRAAAASVNLTGQGTEIESTSRAALEG